MYELMGTVAKCARPAQAQAGMGPSAEMGKWTGASVFNQEAIFN